MYRIAVLGYRGMGKLIYPTTKNLTGDFINTGKNCQLKLITAGTILNEVASTGRSTPIDGILVIFDKNNTYSYSEGIEIVDSLRYSLYKDSLVKEEDKN